MNDARVTRPAPKRQPRQSLRGDFLAMNRDAAEVRRERLRLADDTGRRWLAAWGLFTTLAAEFADPTEGRVPESVSSLARNLRMDRGTVSGHLHLLEKAGVVKQDGRGWLIVGFDDLQGREPAGSTAGPPAGTSSSPPAETRAPEGKKEELVVEVPERIVEAGAVALGVTAEEIRGDPQWPRVRDAYAAKRAEGFTDEQIADQVGRWPQPGSLSTPAGVLATRIGKVRRTQHRRTRQPAGQHVLGARPHSPGEHLPAYVVQLARGGGLLDWTERPEHQRLTEAVESLPGGEKERLGRLDAVTLREELQQHPGVWAAFRAAETQRQEVA